jgi:hypothetical protein
MKTILFLSSALILTLASCASNDELQDRVDSRTDAYSSLQDRRSIRTDARQERTDDWFDRVMH